MVAAEIRRSVAQRITDPRPGRSDRWTAANVRRALSAYRDANNRLPTKRELNTDPNLPSYTMVRKRLGDRPLSLF
jgi:hypothetical protein